MSKTQTTRLLLCAIVSIQFCALIGCHRSYYRRQADAEAERLILQKSADPRWDSATGNIDVDPMSRMFNPFSQDHPPIPPDDPTSHEFLHRVDGKDGYPHWHANGDTEYVENPEWRSYLPMNENNEAVLSLSSAYQLALIHSPTLQQQRESLYLSALDVSLERFGFDSQLFSGFNNLFQTTGRIRNGGTSSTTLTNQIGVNGGGLNLQRLGITGTNFAVGLANTIIWNFSGANTQSASSLIDFSIIQPLLRGAGRDRILESLTQSERTLLANVRQLERFRRGFYLQIATGRNPGQGVSFNSGAFLGTPGTGTGNIGGYFGLLLQQQQIRNQEFNVRQQEALLKQFDELFERDRINGLLVSQFKSSVYQQQQTLLNARVNYQDSLDRFKQQLGLPPSLEIKIEDPSLDGFNLIGDRISNRLIQVGKLRLSAGAAIDAMSELIPTRSELPLNERGRLESEGEIEFSNDLETKAKGLLPSLKQAKAVIVQIKSDDRSLIVDDIDEMDSVRENRTRYLAKLSRAIDSGDVLSEVDPALFETQSVPTKANLMKELEGQENERSPMKNLARAEQAIDKMIDQITSYQSLRKEMTDVEFYLLNDGIVKQLPDVLSEVEGVVLEFSLLQAEARTNTVEIVDVDIDAKQSLETARCLRRDWMNARAALVDSWRQIEFVADQLEAQVDIVFQGDIGNVGDNPFDLRSANGSLGAGLRFDAPIVRMQERNNYRQTLISYQQSRRSYYQFEDEISRGLRQTIRNINQNKILFELNRQSIQVNIEQVEQARARLEQPPRPGQQSGFSDTTAQDLTRAINALTGVQNQYLRAWVEYEVLRRNLDFDLGTMELGETGEWVDPGMIDNSIGVRAASRMGFQLDCRFCNDMGVSTSSMATSYVDDGSANYESIPVEGQAIYADPPPYESTDPISSPDMEFDSINELKIEPIDAPVPEIEVPKTKVPELDVPEVSEVGQGKSTEHQTGKIMLIGENEPPMKSTERESFQVRTAAPVTLKPVVNASPSQYLRPFSSAGRSAINQPKNEQQSILLTAAASTEDNVPPIAHVAHVEQTIPSQPKSSWEKVLAGSPIESANPSAPESASGSQLKPSMNQSVAPSSAIPKVQGWAIDLIPSLDEGN